MDLLNSLILPNTGSAQTQSPAQLLQHAVNTATPELKQQLLRSLAVLCNGTGSAVSATSSGSAAGISSSPPHDATIPQICGFWYHYGDCRRDPSSPTYDGSIKLCPYLHYIKPGMEDVMCQRLFKASHRAQCNLSRCPLSTRPRLQRRPIHLQSPIRQHDGQDRQSVVGAEMRGQKRPRSETYEGRHAKDVPEPQSKSVNTIAETCFFWSVIDYRLFSLLSN